MQRKIPGFHCRMLDHFQCLSLLLLILFLNCRCSCYHLFYLSALDMFQLIMQLLPWLADLLLIGYGGDSGVGGNGQRRHRY